jgi:hypothetical protein
MSTNNLSLVPGAPGTVAFTDVIIPSTTSFNSFYGLSTPAIVSTLTTNIPTYFVNNSNNGLTPQWRVIIELNASMITNQILTNNTGFIGIGTTQQGTNGIGTTTGMASGIAVPSIQDVTCVADNQLYIATVTSPTAPVTAKYIATYSAGQNVAFTVLAAAAQASTTFNVSGYISLTAYPIYS